MSSVKALRLSCSTLLTAPEHNRVRTSFRAESVLTVQPTRWLINKLRNLLGGCDHQQGGSRGPFGGSVSPVRSSSGDQGASVDCITPLQ